MTDLPDFLLARIAEDEKAARGGTASFGIAELFNGWDAPRVLAECEVKRQVIEVLTGAEPQSDAWHRGRQALQRLALPYADHPDYHEEWRP